MIELHERLSEFSYGYGATREAEDLLLSVGIKTVPFLPSLIQEKDLGFDVSFSKPGVPLLLQFKLGQSLEKFVRTDKRFPAPEVSRPFFRFSIDTAEPDGQFETLLKAELDGAEAYYVAPRFVDWPQYATFYEEREILDQSVMISPVSIRNALIAKNSPDGPHRIVYDRRSVHVCSEPSKIEEVRASSIADDVRRRVSDESQSLGDVIWHIYEGFENRSELRRSRLRDPGVASAPETSTRMPDDRRRAQRRDRLERLKAQARSAEDAIGAALGLELWALGARPDIFLVGAF
ncbi:hypothetical protein NLM31_03155 [Bradyrhizobium sp. CCGUVB4N]|uniref:hypothetical protein n=1 Tax=Bradyrhizobium sp. CCGUVB4N TaxID=2949631 RepID=UPI0020B45248|nr:hypothetical protein [Bradyrhizobium sp. CCGUVB4N]MCP3379440.1 hypothetical protein [Bradyrhizobium sp. CCGUVB4N]